MKKKIILYGVMVLFLSLFLIFLILDISIYKVSYITSKLDEAGYYKTLYEKIYDRFDTKLTDGLFGIFDVSLCIVFSLC